MPVCAILAILVTTKHDEMLVTRTPANLHHDYLGLFLGLKMKSISSIKKHIYCIYQGSIRVT